MKTNDLDLWLIQNFGFGNENLAKFTFTLLVSLIILTIPILISLIFPLITKGRLSKKTTVLIYAFVTGFFICMALFGFARESLETVTTRGFSDKNLINAPKWQLYLVNITIVGGGIALGLSIAYGLRKLGTIISKNKNLINDPEASAFIHSHELSHDNDHIHYAHGIAPDHSVKRPYKVDNASRAENKVLALLLLLTHRIPAGILIGYSLNAFFVSSNSLQFGGLSLAFMISFILHLIPEQIIFYYRQREMGISRLKASLWTIGSLLLFFPLMLIGIYLGKYLNEYWYLNALISAIVAGIFLFTAVVEFLPEFYHSHHDKKIFRIVMLIFMLGIVICAMILSFHEHGTFNF
ncbi:ZIP family metal transporter [Mycoplasmopsis gallinarum]|uniref:Metal transporter n=1 Tax=Mycoplasmopsis gallinarum TaxID=29557 RepID=A0A168RHJ7_9BACT|nr:ZIP family metal transporter [Mycoplasmopsis gallinarum]OAB48994.1 hypothetical protein MGALLINA_03260 [Mycoplasmopsis gallinarum]